MHSENIGRRSFAHAKIAICAVVVVVALPLAWFFMQRANTTTSRYDAPIDTATEKQIGFTLYYPRNFPQDFSYKPGSLNVQSTAVVFTLEAPNGDQLQVTEQPRPPLTEELTKTKQFDTPVGKAYISELDNRTTGIINTQNTLIIVNAPGKINTDTLQHVLSAFKDVE